MLHGVTVSQLDQEDLGQGGVDPVSREPVGGNVAGVSVGQLLVNDRSREVADEWTSGVPAIGQELEHG